MRCLWSPQCLRLEAFSWWQPFSLRSYYSIPAWYESCWSICRVPLGQRLNPSRRSSAASQKPSCSRRGSNLETNIHIHMHISRKMQTLWLKINAKAKWNETERKNFTMSPFSPDLACSRKFSSRLFSSKSIWHKIICMRECNTNIWHKFACAVYIYIPFGWWKTGASWARSLGRVGFLQRRSISTLGLPLLRLICLQYIWMFQVCNF